MTGSQSEEGLGDGVTRRNDGVGDNRLPNRLNALGLRVVWTVAGWGKLDRGNPKTSRDP